MALPQIRNATPYDVAAMFELRCSVRENHLSREELAKRDITPESVRQMLTSGEYIALVAVIDGAIAGFTMALIAGGYIFALFVREEHEGKGLGRALLGEVEARLAQRGLPEAWLHTGSEDGIRASGFYRHLGWRDCGLMKDGQRKFRKRLNRVEGK